MIDRQPLPTLLEVKEMINILSDLAATVHSMFPHKSLHCAFHTKAFNASLSPLEHSMALPEWNKHGESKEEVL